MTQQLTLELAGIELSIDRFLSYVPRQPIIDQRASFTTSPFGASIIRDVGFEMKNTLRFSLITSDESKITELSKIYYEQKLLIAAKTFDGITVTDEMHRFLEKAVSPTRQKTAEAYIDEGNGYISYFAKFLMGMILDFPEPNGKAAIANVILIEFDKLV